MSVGRRSRRYVACQYHMPIPEREADGAFTSFEDWCSRATRLIGGENALCVDAADRICWIGKDFMTARDEGKFPVRFYLGAGNQTATEQRRLGKEADRVLHPHRPPALRAALRALA